MTDHGPKIGIFSRPIDQGAGSGSHLLNLIRTLDSMDTGLDLYLIHDETPGHAIHDQFPSMVVPRNPLRAATMVRQERFDIIHAAPPTLFTPFWVRGPWKVATVHSLEALTLVDTYPMSRRLHDRHVLRAMARTADLVFTVSDYSKAHIVEAYGIDPRRIEVAYNGVSPAFHVLEGNEATAAEAHLRATGVEGPYILHVSSFRARKNPRLLLQSFRRLLDDHDVPDDLKLVIGGGRWDSPAADRLCREAGVADRVVRPGFVSEELLVALLNGARAFAFPTLFEGFGMPNIEAMACGCPVVTTDGGAVREVVGDAAIVLDPACSPEAFAEALATACVEGNARDGMVAAGLLRAKLFTWEDCAKTLLTGYQRLLEGIHAGH